MSYSTIYADSLTAYQNGQNMANAIQKKIENIADNEVLFGKVDYSSSYNGILDDFKSSASDGDGTGSSGEAAEDGASSGSGELAADGGTKATEEQMQQLREAYAQVQDEQGWVGKAWNGIKNFFGHSNGSNAVEETLNKAEAGEISYEAAVEKLNTYASKQDSIVDTVANVASGLAVAVGVIAAPFSFGASLALGAGVGAAVKVGIKATDAATNDVEGDYTLKDGLKDGVTGAVGGVVTAATAGIGAGGAVVKEGGKVLVKETIKQGVVAGAKAGAIDGAVMGATNYTADAVFDGDEFTFGGLVSNTTTGAIGGAVVGGTVGGLTSGFRAHGVNKAANSAAKEAGEEAVESAGTAAAKEVGKEAAESAGVATAKEAGEEAAESAAKAGVKSAPKIDIDSEVSTFLEKSKGMNTAQQREYINNLVQEGKITSEADLLKFFNNKTGVAKTTMGGGSKYRQVLKEIENIKAQGGVSQVANELPEVPNTRLEALEEKIADMQINNLDDALQQGYTVDELKALGYYDKLNAGSATNSASSASNTKFGQLVTGAKDNLVNLFKKGANLKNMSPKDIRKAFTGKANATAKDFKAAYEAMKQTNDYKTNLLFRTFVEDAYNIGSAE